MGKRQKEMQSRIAILCNHFRKTVFSMHMNRDVADAYRQGKRWRDMQDINTILKDLANKGVVL